MVFTFFTEMNATKVAWLFITIVGYRYLGDEYGYLSVLKYDVEEENILQLAYHVPPNLIAGTWISRWTFEVMYACLDNMWYLKVLPGLYAKLLIRPRLLQGFSDVEYLEEFYNFFFFHFIFSGYWTLKLCI